MHMHVRAAEAVLNLQEIARAHERVVAITWGCAGLGGACLQGQATLGYLHAPTLLPGPCCWTATLYNPHSAGKCLTFNWLVAICFDS